MPILRRFFSVIRRKKTQRLIDTCGDDDDITPSPASPLQKHEPIDSAFCASYISNGGGINVEWEKKLERIHQYGEDLSLEWYQTLEQLASMMDKVTSPFQNTNRMALHKAQKFIESYLDDWKSHRYQKQGDDDDNKMQQVNQQFSDQVDLKNCVMKIYQLEKDLYHYRCTLDDQLTELWDIKQKDQQTETWKHHWQAYHQTSNQMESKFKAILETCTPKVDEYTCAVCLSLFTEPITLQPCLHTFCKSCVQHIYCTCRLTQCDSSCHDPANRPSNMVDEEEDLNIPKKKLSRQFSGTYKPRYRHLITTKTTTTTPPPPSPSPEQQQQRRQNGTLGSSLKKRFSLVTTGDTTPLPPKILGQEKVTLRCDCPLSWSVPPAAQCPLCRHPFGPEDCRLAVGLDNLICFYFPRHDRVRQKYDARERQLNRRRSLSAWKLSTLPSVPLPPRRQSPQPQTTTSQQQHHNNINMMSMMTISNDLSNLARRSFIV